MSRRKKQRPEGETFSGRAARRDNDRTLGKESHATSLSAKSRAVRMGQRMADEALAATSSQKVGLTGDVQSMMRPQDKPTWAGAITYGPSWDYMNTTVAALAKNRQTSQHDEQAYWYDTNIRNVLHEASVLKMHPSQFDALPDWENPEEGIDYALNTELPFRSIYFEVCTRDEMPDYRMPTLAASPYAFLMTRLPDGGLWIVPFAKVTPKGKNIVNDRGMPMNYQHFILPTIIIGGIPIGDGDGWNEWHVNVRASDKKPSWANPISSALSVATGYNHWAATGLHSSTEIDLAAVLDIPDVRGRVLFADCTEQQYRVQRHNYGKDMQDSLLGLRTPVYPENEEDLSRNLIYFSQAPVKLALKALSALSILDAAEVEIVDLPMERRDLRRAEKRKWKISQIVRIGKPSQGIKREPTGEERHFSHRFWVRGHVKHYGPHTRIYQNREDLVTPCTRHGARMCPGGYCRKVKTAPFLKGPADKPVIAKSRIWARPQQEETA